MSLGVQSHCGPRRIGGRSIDFIWYFIRLVSCQNGVYMAPRHSDGFTLITYRFLLILVWTLLEAKGSHDDLF